MAECFTTTSKTSEAEPTMSETTSKEETTTSETPSKTTTTEKEAISSTESSSTSKEETTASSEASADCFTAAGIFETPDGLVRADRLKVGDKIKTMTNGFRPIRYIMHRRVLADRRFAPVTFLPGSLSNSVTFECSRKHRLYSGTIPNFRGRNKDHLLCAYEMIDGSTVFRRADGRQVDYYHFLLDQHDLVVCSGIVSESWVPSKTYLDASSNAADIFDAFANKSAALAALEGPWVRETITFDRANMKAVTAR